MTKTQQDGSSLPGNFAMFNILKTPAFVDTCVSISYRPKQQKIFWNVWVKAAVWSRPNIQTNVHQ
jgi:hypothetical protein